MIYVKIRVCLIDKSGYLWNILGVYTVYGVADVLLGGDDEGEGEHTGGRHTVVQPEHPAVYVDVGHVQQPPQLPEYLQHPQSLSCRQQLDSTFTTPCHGRTAVSSSAVATEVTTSALVSGLGSSLLLGASPQLSKGIIQLIYVI